MHVVFHIGMHCTDEDMALRCLLRNGEELARVGTVVPPPGKFKPVLREAMIALKGAPADADLQARMVAAVTEGAEARRLVFSNDNFLCPPARAAQGPLLYPLAQDRMPWIRNLFPDSPVTFALALRNPVTLLPAIHPRFAKGQPFADYLAGIEPEALSWADAVTRMRAGAPDAGFVLWCNEDAPLIWPQVLGALSGVEDPAGLRGADDMLARIMTEAGLARMKSYLESHPPPNPAHRIRVTAAFLDKFARPEAVEMELDETLWSAESVARITARYEADVAAIREMDGITFLAP